MQEIALLVMSCDKYSSAWYPYFELLKKYWPDHPKKIYLSTETRSFSCPGLDINIINSNTVEPWSQRLLNVLKQIPEEYIIFSLEDFFLLGNVDNARIKECYNMMLQDNTIAEFRLTTYDTITTGEFYKSTDFRICPKEHPFRVDTQAALWKKSFLISVIDPIETPWQFEGGASVRSRELSDKLLWLSTSDNDNLNMRIVPYHTLFSEGYGIAWGKWLPKNKKWFLKNGIKHVKYHQLGALSERDVKRRKKYLYTTPTSVTKKIIQLTYQQFVYADRVIRELLLTGSQGMKNLMCILNSRKRKS